MNLQRIGAIAVLIGSLAVVNMSAQSPGSDNDPGLFGPVTAHPKAGDFAPDVTFTQLLSSPDSSSWSSANLSGTTTMLVFFPNISLNPKPMAEWNATIERFAGKPVQFVLITSEKQSTLLPWLAQHPLKGWVLYDPNSQTGRAYGLEQQDSVLIGPDRRIVGFNQETVPDDRTVNAVLAGEITTTPQTAATIQTFIQSGLTLLHAEPSRMPRSEDHRPNFPPSQTVHITPAASDEGCDCTSPDFWNLQNFTLGRLLARVYDTNPVRIVLPSSLDADKRYDVAVVLPAPGKDDEIPRLVQQALSEYFHISMAREDRLTDVYVVTAPNGRPPASDSEGSGFLSIGGGGTRTSWPLDPEELQKAMSRGMNIDSVEGISASNFTMDDFCDELEGFVDHPVLNETHLQGGFDIQVRIEDGSGGNIRDLLRTKMNLVVNTAQRSVEMFIFRPS